MKLQDHFTCGDANPNGNITFRFKGSCGKAIAFKDAYRCTGCGGFFHRDCIFEHFEKEEGHSVAHNALRKIKDLVSEDGRMPQELEDYLHKLCEDGLSRAFQRKSFLP